MNNLPKNWWTSRTIWASLVAGLMPIAAIASQYLGFVLPSQDTVVNDLTALGTVVSAGIAIWGRVAAQAPIATSSNSK